MKSVLEFDLNDREERLQMERCMSVNSVYMVLSSIVSFINKRGTSGFAKTEDQLEEIEYIKMTR